MKSALGGLVRKSFRAPKKKSKKRSASVSRRGNTLKLHFKWDEEVLEEAPVIPLPQAKSAVSAGPPLPAPIPETTPARVNEIQRVSPTESVPKDFLSTSEFIRPDEKLKSSLEGFVFDLRSEHTRASYQKDFKRFIKFLLVREQDFGSEILNRTIVIAYKDWLLTDGLQHTTVDRHLASLKSLFKWFIEDGIVEKNPAVGIRFLKPKRFSTTVGFTDKEVAKVLSKPNLHRRTGAMHYAVLMILFYCGLRRSELCQLRTSNFGEEHGHKVMRLMGKGNKERIVPLMTPVWNALVHYLRITRKNLNRDQYLFSPIRNNRTGVKDKPIDPSMVYHIVKRYSKEAGVANRVSPHSCRATAISNARDNNVSDRAIQEFAGWSSTDMITRYDKRKTAVTNSAALSIRYGKADQKIPRWVEEEAELEPFVLDTPASAE